MQIRRLAGQYAVASTSAVPVYSVTVALLIFLISADVRGSKYSYKHASLTPNDPRFWDFSLDQQIALDIPAMLTVRVMLSFAALFSLSLSLCSCRCLVCCIVCFSLCSLVLAAPHPILQYVLEATGAPTLAYIGFSQGTALGLGALAVHPALAARVSILIALASTALPRGL
jgi:hypothetical protein